jgi:hypothetical protein
VTRAGGVEEAANASGSESLNLFRHAIGYPAFANPRLFPVRIPAGNKVEVHVGVLSMEAATFFGRDVRHGSRAMRISKRRVG